MLSNFFEPHYEDNNGKLWSVEKLLEMVSDWEDPNPKPIIKEYDGIKVVRDDLLNHGSKIRFVDKYIRDVKAKEIVFGCCPATGYAQISLPVVANKYGKKVVLFMAKRSPDKYHEYQKRGMDLGAIYEWVNMGMLSVTKSRAKKYYEEDPNMRWESAPKPRLTSKTYKSNYLHEGITEEERYKKIEDRDMILTEQEPLFDAAEILRFGKDLFYHNNFTSNLKGLNWLRRHFPNHRVHQINLPGELIPTHIDACFTPIKPGVIIINPNRKISQEQRKIFDDNKWEIHAAAPSVHNTPPPMCYSTIWLSMNVLILNPTTICVEASEEKMIKQMESFGMNVIPVPFRDVYAFGGSLHCATTDVYREGNCEDYFPNQ